MKWFLTWVLIALMAMPSMACDRCGLFGRRCRFAAASGYYTTPQYVDRGDVFVVQNNYPQPLVAQGSMLYAASPGYQHLAAPLLDPDRYFSQELQLIKAAQDINAERMKLTNASFTRAMELYAPATERIAAGQAASMVLNAAGLSEPTGTHQSQALVLSRDKYGQFRVQTLTAEQSLQLTEKIEGKFTEEVNEANAAATSLVGKYCGKCHGVGVADPKGGLYIGNDANVARGMREHWFEITSQVGSGKMPPESAPQPTQEERVAIINEMQEMIQSQAKENP